MRPCRCTKVGVPQYPNLCTGGCSFPRQGLPRARRRPSCSMLSHSKTKYARQKIETPASGACREGRTRLKTTSLAQGPGKRSLPGRLEDSFIEDPARARGAASSRVRQDQGPGKVLAGKAALCARAPAHRPTRRPGATPGTRGGWLCSLGDTVALHGGEAIAVANGDARAGALGVDGDGH